MIQRRKRNPAGEPAERGHGLDLPRTVDPVDLSRLAAGPEVAVAIEGDALRTREAASRIRCLNNLKQIGLATHNYHDTNLWFPPSYIRQDWPTFAVFLLPYLEQENIYKLWDTQLRYYDQPNFGNPTLDPTPQN